MAMRQSGSGYSTTRRRQTNRPIYEDFQPMSETKEEEGAQIVTFRLHGFLKDQIKLTAVHYPRIIRIQGERPLGNNKWSRFNQTFPIPPNSDVNKVHSKFNNGVLTVVLPKEIKTKTSQPATDKSKTTDQGTPTTSKAGQQKAQKVQDHEKQKDERNTQKAGVAEPKEAKGQEGIPPKGVWNAENYGKQRNDQKIIDHPLKNVVDQQKMDIIETSSKKTEEKAKDQSNKDLNEAKLKTEDRGKIYLQEKERIMKKDRESLSAADPKADITTTNKIVEKEKEKGNKFEAEGTTTKEKQIKELSETSIIDGKAEKIMKKDEKDEDSWQTMINIGAAILVLVSFGAYVSYSLFGSFGKTKSV